MLLAVAILAGGKSRRMGRDKALLPWEGATLLARTVALAAQAVHPSRILVVGRGRPTGWSGTDETVFLPDDNPSDGPLAAIATALKHAKTVGCDRVAVLPCDLPLLTTDALRWLIEQAAKSELDDGLAVIGSDERIEPLFSIYPTRCHEIIAARLVQGDRSPTALIMQGGFRIAVAPEFVLAALVDADTPEAWQALVGTDIPVN